MTRGSELSLSFIARTVVLAIFAALVALGCSRFARSSVRYHCPMHPTYVSDRPGDCPICGMRLVPITSASGSAAATRAPTSAVDDTSGTATDTRSSAPSSVPGYAPLEISSRGLALAGVKVAVAERGSIARTVRAAGVVRADETRIRHVHTKVAGWIERLYADFTGQSVQKGRPILSIYSQELLASQEEYLRAREAAQKLAESSTPVVRRATEDLLAAARRRLQLFDVPDAVIAELDRSGTPRKTVTLLAPASGIVTGKQIFEGMQVEPGTELFTVADLSRVWIEADVYENEASSIRVGQDATIVLPAELGAPIGCKVQYVYPYLDPQTRTVRIRFDVPNRESKLKLDLFVDVELPIQTDRGVIVPDSAIMDTGLRQIAFVSREGGHFEPREVKVGIRAEGKAQVLSGIAEGEQIAIKANFLLDSESRLRAAIRDLPTPAAAPSASGATP
jgi:RND family efflux transporter MFP subunit